MGFGIELLVPVDRNPTPEVVKINGLFPHVQIELSQIPGGGQKIPAHVSAPKGIPPSG